MNCFLLACEMGPFLQVLSTLGLALPTQPELGNAHEPPVLIPYSWECTALTLAGTVAPGCLTHSCRDDVLPGVFANTTKLILLQSGKGQEQAGKFVLSPQLHSTLRPNKHNDC